MVERNRTSLKPPPELGIYPSFLLHRYPNGSNGSTSRSESLLQLLRHTRAVRNRVQPQMPLLFLVRGWVLCTQPSYTHLLPLKNPRFRCDLIKGQQLELNLKQLSDSQVCRHRWGPSSFPHFSPLHSSSSWQSQYLDPNAFSLEVCRDAGQSRFAF